MFIFLPRRSNDLLPESFVQARVIFLGDHLAFGVVYFQQIRALVEISSLRCFLMIESYLQGKHTERLCLVFPEVIKGNDLRRCSSDQLLVAWCCVGEETRP